MHHSFINLWNKNIIMNSCISPFKMHLPYIKIFFIHRNKAEIKCNIRLKSINVALTTNWNKLKIKITIISTKWLKEKCI